MHANHRDIMEQYCRPHITAIQTNFPRMKALFVIAKIACPRRK